ncbi:MAG TPA: DUF202 domain-containing protein [Dissulfurispiraceae bacterium]|nr:DUF202 domain-containing protein [Dissulfurispiraceae bacterium]
MELQDEQDIHPNVRNRRVHMANERTFLAWIRTSIGIMAFGFVLEKFALLVRQFALFVDKSGISVKPIAEQSFSYSSIWGILLVGLGALMGVLAFFRYKTVERQIDEDSYQHSILLDLMLMIAVLATGIFLVLYLIHNF